MGRIRALLLLLCAASWGLAQDAPWPTSPTRLPAIRHPKLKSVKRWAYWIQDPELSALRACDADLLVIDYARDGTQETAFSKAQVASLREAGKTVVAYLSVGEAEDYRVYWGRRGGRAGADWKAHPPAWLGPENPEWEGNYTVRYWDPAWQQLVIHNPGGHPTLGDEPSALDRILDAGFDGVFLDVVDAFEHWGPEGDGGNAERPTAAADMAAFVVALAAYARTRDPDFVVCQQNGEGLLSPDLERPLPAVARKALLAAVDWLSVEDVIYRGDAEQNNPFAPDAQRIRLIDAYRAQGKLVTVIDYFDPAEPGFEQRALDDYGERASGRGWLPYSGPRALDRLGTWSPGRPK